MKRFSNVAGIVTPIALVLCLTLVQVEQAKGQAVVAGATVGAVLDHLMSKVKEAEEEAIAGGIVLEIGAGGEVALAIQQAKTAYTSSLDLTLSKANGEVQTGVNSLNSLVDQLAQHNYGHISDLEKQARIIIHDLPMTRHFPQVISINPHYIISKQKADTPDIEFEIKGDFVDLPTPGYDPSLKLSGDSGKPFKAVAKSSDFIVFKLPASVFTPSDSTVVTKFLTIDIPYTSDSWFHRQAHTEFVMPIVTLSKSVGQIVITSTSPQQGTVRQQVTSPEMSQNSAQDDIKEGGPHADLTIHRWSADAGWRIIPSSVTYKMNRSEGKQGYEKDWWFGRNLSTLQEAVLTFNTEHHRIGTSGKIWFNIVLTEEKDVVQNAPSTYSFTMNWGDSKVIEVRAGATWKGSFTRFDGTTQEFSGPFDNKFIKVSQAGSVITLSAIP